MNGERPQRYTALQVYAVMFDVLRRRGMRGYLPFEGQWFTREGLDRKMHHNSRRAWVVTFELLLLMGAMTGVAGLLIALIRILAD